MLATTAKEFEQYAPAITAAMIWRTAPADVRQFISEPDAEVLAFADVIEKRMQLVRKAHAACRGKFSSKRFAAFYMAALEAERSKRA